MRPGIRERARETRHALVEEPGDENEPHRNARIPEIYRFPLRIRLILKTMQDFLTGAVIRQEVTVILLDGAQNLPEPGPTVVHSGVANRNESRGRCFHREAQQRRTSATGQERKRRKRKQAGGENPHPRHANSPTTRS